MCVFLKKFMKKARKPGNKKRASNNDKKRPNYL